MTGPQWGDAPPRVVYYPAPTDGKAIAALILAVMSFVVCPVLPAVVALVLANESRQRIAVSGGAVQGEGLNTAAVALAWINIAGCGMFFLVLLLGQL